MKEKIKKYIPDIIVLVGIWIFFYAIFFPITGGGLPSIRLGYDYSNHFKFIGVILITIGVDMIIRKYLSSKK